MGRKCVVRGCQTQPTMGISRFRIPQNKIAEWEKILKCPLTTNRVICELHFASEFIIRERVFRDQNGGLLARVTKIFEILNLVHVQF